MSPKTPAYRFINTNLAHARDGEVVLYRRESSKRWQTRFKLNDSKWRRQSTKQVNIDYAARVACEAYDKARFLRDENLPLNSKRFDAVAKIAADDMRAQLAGGQGKSVYYSYIGAIEKYLVPFFGKHDLSRVDYKLVKSFDAWRAKKMGKEPVASTVTNHTCAFNRVYDAAIERGWISKLQVPKMANKGVASVARPAFSANEYTRLTSYMAKWATKGHTAKTREMRELLRDYEQLSQTALRVHTAGRML